MKKTIANHDDYINTFASCCQIAEHWLFLVDKVLPLDVALQVVLDLNKYSTGTYFYQMQVGAVSDTKKLILKK